MKKNDKNVSVGMPQELYDILAKQAKEEFRSVPNYIRYILREYIKEKEPV